MMSDVMIERWKNPNYKELRSSDTKDLWENLEYRKKQKDAHRKVNSIERKYIQKLKEMGCKVKDLSQRFKVSTATINRIILGLN